MGFGYCWLRGWFVVLLIAVGKCAGWLFVLAYVCLCGLFGGGLLGYCGFVLCGFGFCWYVYAYCAVLVVLCFCGFVLVLRFI